MHVRVLALLLALLVAAGLASPTLAASSDVVGDVAGLVEDGAPEADPVIAEWPAGFEAPVRGELRLIVAPPADPQGRLHHAWVFRPPRRIASR